MPTEVKTKTEELRETENEDEVISVEEMTQILKTKGIDIKTLALEAKKLREAMENREYKTTEQTGKKKTYRASSTGPEFTLELSAYPDFAIKKISKTTKKLMVIMPSVKTYYVKDLKTNEITPLNADEYSKFTTQMDDIINLPDDFWITGIKKSKYFWERLSSILYDDTILELIKMKLIDQINAERLCDRSTWRGNDELKKINNIKKPFAVNKKLFKEFFNEKTADGNPTKASYLVRNMDRQSFIPDLVETFGLNMARDFLKEIDISLVSIDGNGYYDRGIGINNVYGYTYRNIYNYTPNGEADKYPDSPRPRINMDYKTFKEYVLYTSVKMGYGKNMRQFFNIWNDTLKMQIQIYGKIKEKYPQDLPLMHNILSYKSILYSQEISTKAFEKTSKICQQYEVNMDGFRFTTPRCKQDMIDEATMQANCLASYVDRYASGTSWIYFMRKKEDPDNSYITIEVIERDDHENPGEKTLQINQCYLAHNKVPNNADREIADKWLKRIIKKYKKNNYPKKYKDIEIEGEEEEKEDNKINK